MASFPGAIKTFTNPGTSDKTTSPSHAAQHGNANDEITAIETALGANLANIYSPGGTDVPVADGGTGKSSVTAYAVICGGTASTSGFQSMATGTAGQVIVSGGAAALPSCFVGTAGQVAFFTTGGAIAGTTGTAGQVLVSGGTGAPSFTTLSTVSRGTFANGDLSTGVLTVTHNKGLSAPYPLVVQVYNNSAQQIIPDQVTGLTNTFTIDLTSYGSISGTWGYAYIA